MVLDERAHGASAYEIGEMDKMERREGGNTRDAIDVALDATDPESILESDMITLF